MRLRSRAAPATSLAAADATFDTSRSPRKATAKLNAMAPRTTKTSTAAGMSTSALPRSPITAPLRHAAPVGIEDLAVPGFGGHESSAERADPRDVHRGHRVPDLERDPRASLERE